MRSTLKTFILAFTFAASSAQAQLTIDIVGGGASQIPIGILPFAAETTLPHSVTSIVQADLERSGRFRVVAGATPNPLPTEPAQVNFTEWRGRAADALVIGGVTALNDGRYEVRFRLLDVPKGEQLTGLAYAASANQ